MDDTIDYLASHAMYLKGTKEHDAQLTATNGTSLGATVGMIWLDIEGTQVHHYLYLYTVVSKMILYNNEILIYTSLRHLLILFILLISVLVQLGIKQRQLSAGHGGRGPRARGQHGGVLELQPVGAYHGQYHSVFELASLVRPLGLFV
jgi:hypothetical protein